MNPIPGTGPEPCGPFALLPVRSVDHPWFAAADALYRDAFPSAERREGLAECLGHPRHALELVAVDGSFAGLVVTWDLGGFTFLEHVATVPRLRGTGIGGAVISRVLSRSTLLVAEAEPAEAGPDAVRRLALYARLGLQANDVDYVQPSYGPGKPRVPMRLLSAPRPLSAGEAAGIAAILERTAYAAGGATRVPGSDEGAWGLPNR